MRSGDIWSLAESGIRLVNALAGFPNPTPRPLRVVHVVLALNTGGLERVVIDLARRTDPTRYRVAVVCIKERGTLAEQAEKSGIRVVSLDCAGRGLGTTLYRTIRCLRRLRPDILHTHNPRPHFVGSMAAAVLRIPTVIHTKHGRNYPENRHAVWANRVASLVSDPVVAVSSDAARVATDVERVPRRKVRTIHNGIDLSRFSFRDRAGPHHAGPVRAIHVARLDPIKDQKTLLESVRIVADRVPGFRLTVVGDGPMRDELHALSDRLHLRGSVEFLGERTDVHALLSDADVFVLSSLKEGLSLTLLEAMATGLAVVATDVGGNREVVVPGKTGLLVPSQSPERLAEAILKLIESPEVVREMGRRGREKVEQQFSLEAMVRQYESLYAASRGRVRGRAACPSA